MQFDNSSPIWLQLVAEFSRRIVVGTWPQGTKLPSVREIASDMGVNPNTAQRALAELEDQHLCRSERTTGRFVTNDTQRIEDARSELAEAAADDFIRRAQGFGVQYPTAQQLIKERWTGNDHRHQPPTNPGRD